MLQAEIIVDSFAGGGGASTGIEMALHALGLDDIVDIAINHSGAALAMHEANHPGTAHMESDIWTVDPLATTQGRPVGLLWASPDCRHFSRAKGKTPVSAKIRGLAWSIANWAELVKPRLIFLENVEEFLTWGPLVPNQEGDMVPDPKQAGHTFRQWLTRFRKLGYRIDWKVLRACDYGAPTIRRRLYIIMRCDAAPIVWPKPTHGDPTSFAVLAGKLLPWPTAAEIIDWSRPCPSIFMSAEDARVYKAGTGVMIKRPIKPKTFSRIANGIKKHVLERPQPIIISCCGESGGRNDRSHTVDGPLRTLTTGPRHGLIMPIMASHHGTDIGSPVDVPLRTITGKPKIDPLACVFQRLPLDVFQVNQARRVADYLREYGAWDDREVVSIGDLVMVDIGMRMLTPRELALGQGFPGDYVLDAPYGDGTLGVTAQRHKIGNSVCPPVAAAIVAANYIPQARAVIPTNQGWLFEGEAA